MSIRRRAEVGYRLAQLGACGAALGGLVDSFVPRLLPHHESYLGVAPAEAPAATSALVLLLLHTLGAALVAMGIGALALLADWRRSGTRVSALTAAAIVALAEAMNAWAIWRVGSVLFVGPLACALLVPIGVGLATWSGDAT